MQGKQTEGFWEVLLVLPGSAFTTSSITLGCSFQEWMYDSPMNASLVDYQCVDANNLLGNLLGIVSGKKYLQTQSVSLASVYLTLAMHTLA